MSRSAKVLRYLSNLAFVEAEQWCQITGTITILGVEAGDILGRMIRTQY